MQEIFLSFFPRSCFEAEFLCVQCQGALPARPAGTEHRAAGDSQLFLVLRLAQRPVSYLELNVAFHISVQDFCCQQTIIK